MRPRACLRALSSTCWSRREVHLLRPLLKYSWSHEVLLHSFECGKTVIETCANTGCIKTAVQSWRHPGDACLRLKGGYSNWILIKIVKIQV